VNAARHGLWLILALALAVRLAPMLCTVQVSPEAVETRNLAGNIRAGRGLLLTIKTQWLDLAPVKSFGGRERPVLPAMLVALLGLVGAPGSAAQMFGPLLFLLALALLHRTLTAEAGPEAALGAGLLVALNPVLLGASLAPGAEPAVFFFLALILWSHLRQRSAMLSGLGCALGFLASPAMLLVTVLLALAYAGDAWRHGRPLRLALFVVFAAIGPLWQMSFNHMAGLPPWFFPQAYLLRVLSESAARHNLHQGAIFASPAALFKSQGHEVARLIGRHARDAVAWTVSTRGLGLLIVLTPLAFAGLRQAQHLRRMVWLLWIALAFAALAMLAWFREDPTAGLAIPCLLGLILLVVGVFEILGREPLGRGAGAWRSAAGAVIFTTALIWLTMDLAQDWQAYRQRAVAGRPAFPAAWSKPGLDEVIEAIRNDRGEGRLAAPPVVAGSNPWLLSFRTGLPATILPYDLNGHEWTALLDQAQASFVVIDLEEWEPAAGEHLGDLLTTLAKANWAPWLGRGQIQVWRRTRAVRPTGETPGPPASAGRVT